jgi:ribosomal protein S18 acetylase RimI-like enzyme
MAMFNPALLVEPLHGTENDLDRRIAMASVYFGGRGVRWSWWLCEDMLSRALRRAAPEVFARRGMRRAAAVPGMLAERLLPPVRPLPEVECRPVAGEATRLAFGQLTAVSFGLPYSSASDIYDLEEPWLGNFQGFVGYVKGKPVCTAGTIVSGDAIGFYSIGTLPEHRRRGYAEALMRHAFEIARGDREVRRAVLQSTTAGERLYYQMGFRAVTKFSIYVSP